MTEAAAIPTNRQIYRVALASIIGSVIEQYDFLVAIVGMIMRTATTDSLVFELHRGVTLEAP